MCVGHAAAALGAIGALAAPRLSCHAAASPATIRNSTPSRSRVRTAQIVHFDSRDVHVPFGTIVNTLYTTALIFSIGQSRRCQ